MQTWKQWDDTIENIVFFSKFRTHESEKDIATFQVRGEKAALCQHIIQARRFVRYMNTLNTLRHFIQKMGSSHVCDMLDMIIQIYSCIFVDTFDVHDIYIYIYRVCFCNFATTFYMYTGLGKPFLCFVSTSKATRPSANVTPGDFRVVQKWLLGAWSLENGWGDQNRAPRLE